MKKLLLIIIPMMVFGQINASNEPWSPGNPTEECLTTDTCGGGSSVCSGEMVEGVCVSL